MTLKCPEIESESYLCDDPASYQINGVIVCHRHARRRMESRFEADKRFKALTMDMVPSLDWSGNE